MTESLLVDDVCHDHNGFIHLLGSSHVCHAYLSSWVDFQDFLKFMFPFLEGQQFVFVALQLLFL